MKNKTLLISLISIFIIQLVCISQAEAQQAKQLFQQGLMIENGQGDLQEAINIYEKILADDYADNEVKAKAQLQIGLCYEKMGREEAIKAYELVVQNYKNYEEVFRVASSRLSELQSDEVDGQRSVIKLYDEEANFEDGTRLDCSMLSPDGKKIAGVGYISGQNITVYDRDKKEARLITNYDWTTQDNNAWTYFPVWSPDGKEIAYLCSDWSAGNMEIHISNLEGDSRVLVSQKSNAQIIPRQWSDDGKSILAFFQDDSGFYTIALVSVKNGKITDYYKTQWSGKFIKGDASLSPDGKYIVFSDGPENNLDLYILNTEEGDPVKISNYPMNEHNPLWSPDGEHIVYIKETKGEAFLYGLKMKEGIADGQPFLIEGGMQNSTLMSWTKLGICNNMDLDIHDIHILPMDPETGIPAGNPEPLSYAPTGSNANPAWSDDGKYLAFFTYEYKPEVVILPQNGEAPRYFAIPHPGFNVIFVHDLRWLPDNSGIGFTALDVEDKPILYQLNISTGEWQHWKLPIPGWTRTEWGPGENSVIYSVNDTAAPGLYQLNTLTQESKRIWEPEKEEYYVFRTMKFSRDHKKLLFYMDKARMMIYDFETNEANLLVAGYGNPAFSPDGNQVILSKKGVLYFLSLEGEVLHSYNLKEHFPLGTRIWSYDWAPDGTNIVFMTRNIIFETTLIKNVL